MHKRIQIISQNMKKTREENHLSFSQMAKLLGVKESSVRKLEQGELAEDIYLDILFIIEREFGIEPWLFISKII